MENTKNLVLKTGKYFSLQVETGALSKKNARKLNHVILKYRDQSEKMIAVQNLLESISGRYISNSTYRYHVRNERVETKRPTDQLARKAPNSVLTLMLAKLDPLRSKKPENINLGDWIGVEIECFIPKIHFQSVNDRYTDFHARLAETFKNERIGGVSIKYDGSIRNDDDCFPVEVNILYRRGNDANLEKTCALLNRLGARVNKSCGLHVHLDCRDVEARQASLRGKRLASALPILSAMVPASRRDNQYCRLIKNEIKRGSRYAAINMQAYGKFKTVEVRLHSSTTNFGKIKNWVELLYIISRSNKMSNFSMAGLGNNLDNLYRMASVLKLDASLIEYARKRIAKFSDTSDEEPSETQAAAHVPETLF